MKTGGRSIFDIADELRHRDDMERMRRYGKVEQAAERGIELVWRNSPTAWQRHAGEQLQRVIETHDTFTSDDIIQPLEARGIFTHDNRAIAAVLRAAAKLNLIETTDEFRVTKHLKSHGRPKRVWRVVRRPGDGA